MNQRLTALSNAGISIWLDDLSRKRIVDGSLQSLIDDSSVVGVTTNPTIFAAAFSDLSLYGEELKQLGGVSTAEAIRTLMAADVRMACGLFRGIYEKTKGYDGRVSIEVEPGLAHETQATIEQAALLHELVGEENVLIKIPATKAGLPAIRATIAAGISVNVTLIFSLERYREVMDAYLSGLEDALAAGKDLSKIHSVASVFVSRMDTEIDKRLDTIGTPDALALKGKAALANARLSFAAYSEVFASDRFQSLAAKGGNLQRPLWASTGVKDPALPDTLYVAELVARPCVNTMPEKTLLAFADHGEVTGDTITPNLPAAWETLATLSAIGIDYENVIQVLEAEGVEKFNISWSELVSAVEAALRNG